MNPFTLMPYDNLTFTLYNQEREKEKQLAEELETLTQYRRLTSNYIATLANILSDETPDNERDDRLFGMALLSESVFDTADEHLLNYGCNLRAVISYIRNKLCENKTPDFGDVHKELTLLHSTAGYLEGKARNVHEDAEDLYNDLYDFGDRLKKLLVTVRNRVDATTDDEERYVEEEEL